MTFLMVPHHLTIPAGIDQASPPSTGTVVSDTMQSLVTVIIIKLPDQAIASTPSAIQSLIIIIMLPIKP
jgi:hypothetical protein